MFGILIYSRKFIFKLKRRPTHGVRRHDNGCAQKSDDIELVKKSVGSKRLKRKISRQTRRTLKVR